MPLVKLVAADETLNEMHHLSLDIPSSQDPPSVSKQAFIHRLPNELLADIFHLLIVDATKLNTVAVDDDSQTYHPYSWVSIVHVCSRWSSIVDGTPTLWSHVAIVDDIMVNSIAVMLLRSGNTSLHLTACTVKHPVPDAFMACMDIVLQELPRLCSIDAQVPIACCATIIESLLGLEPSHRLRSLILHSTSAPFSSRDQVKPFHASAQSLALETLIIQGFSVPQIDHFITRHANLREIDIMQFEDMPGMCSLLTVLSHLPLLESITLSSGNVGHDNNMPPSIPTVVLPHLRFLSLWLNLPCDALFIEHLIFPSTTKIDTVLCLFGTEATAGSLSALNVIVSKLKGSGVIGTPPILSSAQFAANEESDVALVVHSEDCPDILSPKFDDFCLRVSFHGNEFNCPPVDRRWALWQQLPLSNLKFVSLDDSAGADMWKKIAEKLDHIEILHLRNTSTFNSFGSLYLDSSPTASPGCFPSLHTLCISVNLLLDAESGINGLMQYLRICQVDGGLKKLIIRSSEDLDEAVILRIRGLVGELVLDRTTNELYAL
ncbi:hypothetical protein QCA50_004727 [Cerrena zonata]|uniref:F-box domain-containing protein n=1 Tax=Cerrena zonata TaxID=2478898 RepID=A0AAW0GD16_9APHY